MVDYLLCNHRFIDRLQTQLARVKCRFSNLICGYLQNYGFQMVSVVSRITCYYYIDTANESMCYFVTLEDHFGKPQTKVGVSLLDNVCH